MKKQSFLSFLVFLTLLASCDLNIDTPDKPKDVNPTSVGFNVYVNRGLQTKAGWGGVLTLDDLKDGTKANGFGVFAYYGNGALYNETMMPDFMYDQQVKWTDNNVWEYSPIKYWPNEFGEAASSEAADRLTFFAYAPFADVTPSTGVVTDGSTTGIIGMSRNISKGDPVVMYSSSLTPGAGVDLCWGVAGEAFTSSVDGDNNNVAAGYPFINVIKPKTGDHLKFEFNHALAQLNVQIDADINREYADDGKTKIYVRSVTFNGFSMRGSLNLNSNKTEGPIWYDISGTGKLKREPVTVYDGRTDGMEGVATATDVSEKPADLNTVLVQSKPYGATGQTVGVTNEAVNLFNGELDAPVMVIPTPGVPMSVTIVYDVETEDSRLTGYLSDGVTHGSSVENKITKTISTDQGNMILSSGKKYVVKLHLGLTSVKFDADVISWDVTPYIPGSAYLPQNTTSIGSVSLTDGTSAYGDMTVWKNETISTIPTIRVLDSDNNEIPLDQVDISWASDNTSVATVDATGAVTIVGAAGVSNITCTASQGEGNSKTASYKVNVNEVTAISVTPATAKISPTKTRTLTATLTYTTNGTISTWPSISWESEETGFVTVSPANASVTYDGTKATATTTATGVAEGGSTITATVEESYCSGTISGTAVVTCTTQTYPEGTSGGVFSVSATKKVYIATSNLMWEGTTAGGSYSLMEYPWSIVEQPGTSVPTNYGINNTTPIQVGLFGWGTPSLPYLTTNNYNSYAPGGFVDWGTMYGDGHWHCLTRDEWVYLLTKRSKAWGFATVNEVHGFIIIPDNFTVPSGLEYTPGRTNGYNTNIYSAAQWEMMQDAGAVFLPAAGHRDPNHGNTIVNAGDDIWYWMTSITYYNSTPDQLLHDSDYPFTISADYRYYGSSVRLFYDKEE
jgi:hypothetical protein